MLKRLSICVTLLALVPGSANAQQTNVVLHRVDVPGADFSIVFAFGQPHAGAPLSRPDQLTSLIVHPIGDELAHATQGEMETLFKDAGASPYPIHAFRVERKDSKPANAVNVYVIPNRRPIASPMR